jgi:ATP-dependent helicase HrpA
MSQHPPTRQSSRPARQVRSDAAVPPGLAALRPAFEQCLLAQRQPLWRRWRQLIERAQRNEDIAAATAQLTEDLRQSVTAVEQRRSGTPAIVYPENLPVCLRREEIGAAIAAHQVVVIAGETGSGKTTQLPKICLELGRGSRGLIGHTQPRRLAARSVAGRIAEELQSPLGELVGYQVRFTDQVSERSRIKLMTDGILLAEIQQDRFLNRYDTLIIDEAHERSLNIDFLLGYLKTLLRKRPDLKLIITSATIDLERFSKHFDNAPIIEVSGRTYPVEVLYRPLESLVDDNDLGLAIEAALIELSIAEKGLKGDVLVFLPGEREIRETALQLRKTSQHQPALAHLDILPLYARLSANEQQRVFDLSKRRGIRVVLATNVAETSITVPGIRYVIDPGLARISRYSFRSKLQRLPIEPISQASAEQRKGRCGRIAPGICVRLYDEQDFARRPQFTDAEILRTNLASVILQLLSLRLGEVDNFPFIDAPDKRQIGDGFSLLEELDAVNARRELTPTGRTLARLPVDPRMARMVLAAAQRGCLREVLIIASALGVQDPRERPADKQQQADEQHRRFQYPESDFLGFVALWDYFESQRQALSQNALRKQCEREFLSYLRLREWRDIHHQLRLVCQELGLKENQQPADYESVHRALLAGLLSHVATQDEQREFLAARNRKLRIFPGSGLFKKPPKWIVAAEIVETAQVYARCNARIEPQWVLGINDDLLKRRHSEPHWHARSGQVMALETVTLYGLVISDRQRVHYGPIDPVQAREIFIRSALVAGDYRTNAPYFRHNRELIADIEELEEKARRRDILADEEELFRFYDERLPADITTARRFEQWRHDAEREQPQLLFAPRERLMRHAAEAITETQFPDSLGCGDLIFALTYHFEPGSDEDGVNVRVPIGLLNRVPEQPFEWLVPGLLRDKCISLLKALPKQYRKLMVPVPDTVDRILPLLKSQADSEPLLAALSAALAQIGIRVPLDAWQTQELEAFYRANFQVFDSDGKLLGQGRELAKLKEQLHAPMTASLQAETQHEFKRTAIAQWDFGELPAAHQFRQAGVTITAYPALVDQGETVALQLLETPERAQAESERGLIRLLQLQTQPTVKWLRKELLRGNLINLQLAGIDQRREDWIEEILTATYRQLFVAGQPLPRAESEFRQRLQAGQGGIIPLAQQYTALLHAIAGHYAQIRQLRRRGSELAWLPVLEDIDRQLAGLFRPGFIAATPWESLQQYPRYLQAIGQRLEKLRGHFQRDRELSRELTPLQQQLDDLLRRKVDPASSPSLLRYRWLLEEYRVSLFAQTLGTREPVSAKRLRELWEQVRKESAQK